MARREVITSVYVIVSPNKYRCKALFEEKMQQKLLEVPFQQLEFRILLSLSNLSQVERNHMKFERNKAILRMKKKEEIARA